MLGLKTLVFIEALLAGGILLFLACLRRPARRIVTPGHIAMILAIPVVGMLGGNRTIFYAFLFFLPLCAMGNARRLACIYALALPLFPELRESYVIGSFYVAELSAILAFNLGGLAALMLVPGKRGPGAAVDAAAWLLFLVCAIMTARGDSLTNALRPILENFLNVIPPYYIVSRTIRTRETAKDVTLFLVLGAVLNAVVALYEAGHHWPLFEAMRRALNMAPGLSLSVSVRAGFMRASGAVLNPTALGILLALALLAWLMIADRFSRAGRWIVAGVLGLALVASQSRGGWLAAVVGLTIYFLYRGRTRAVLALCAAGVMAGAVLLAVPSESRLGQLLGRSGHAESTSQYRSNLLRRGLEEVAAHPLGGQSRAQLEVSLTDMRQGEHIIDFVNTPLLVTLTLGFGGLAAWLAIWFLPMRMAWRLRARYGSAEARAWLAACCGMLGASFVNLIFTSTIDRTIPWTAMSIGLLGALLSIFRNEARARFHGASPDHVPARAPAPGRIAYSPAIAGAISSPPST